MLDNKKNTEEKLIVYFNNWMKKLVVKAIKKSLEPDDVKLVYKDVSYANLNDTPMCRATIKHLGLLINATLYLNRNNEIDLTVIREEHGIFKEHQSTIYNLDSLPKEKQLVDDLTKMISKVVKTKKR
jgi:hypothetical protein